MRPAGRAAAPPLGLRCRRVLQVAVIASGVVVPTMFFLGLVFAVLWFLAMHLGRKVERLDAAPSRDAGADPTTGAAGASEAPGR